MDISGGKCFIYIYNEIKFVDTTKGPVVPWGSWNGARVLCGMFALVVA
jgi:hypothetical protein